METPLKIVLRVAPYDNVVEEEVRGLAAKLEKYYPGIISCRVTVEKPHKHQHTGSLYRATVLLTVPGKQISVNREHPLNKSHEDIFVAVRHAFDDAARQLEDFSLVRHKDVKDHDTIPHGVVVKLFPDGYGFISSFGGREIYFHKNSVLDGFENLKIGTEVRFHEEEGEKGPQASTVKIIKKAHIHHRGH